MLRFFAAMRLAFDPNLYFEIGSSHPIGQHVGLLTVFKDRQKIASAPFQAQQVNRLTG
jgi:hypothetical protein